MRVKKERVTVMRVGVVKDLRRARGITKKSSDPLQYDSAIFGGALSTYTKNEIQYTQPSLTWC
jgi:hypothetical protein